MGFLQGEIEPIQLISGASRGQRCRNLGLVYIAREREARSMTEEPVTCTARPIVFPLRVEGPMGRMMRKAAMTRLMLG